MPRRRRTDGLADETMSMLLRAPVWLGPLLAGIAFALLRFAWPRYFSGDELLHTTLRGIGPTIAPWAAGLLLFGWVIAELQKWNRRWLLDAQSGLESIRALGWQEFERLVGEAYRRQGYAVDETGSSGGDGGVDLVLNVHGETVLVQCKLWRSRSVGVKPVRELYGVLMSESADRAILVTCGHFTREAEAFAAGKPIKLVAGDELQTFVRSAQRSEPMRDGSHATKPSTSAPAASSDSVGATPGTTMTCPKCGSAMIIRTAKRGPNAGSRFWGCSNYPRCKVTSPYDGA